MTALERPGAAEQGARSEARPLHRIFPLAEDGSRGRQMRETWSTFTSEMEQAVRAVLDGRRAPPEIAYALGEIVHNYFRTRGLTLTSFELRHLVVELLAMHTSAPASDELSKMVSFAAAGTRASDWTGDEQRSLTGEPPPVVAEAPPSNLIERLEPHEAAFDRMLLRVLEAARPKVGTVPRHEALAAIEAIVEEALRDEPVDWPADARERLALVALSDLCGLGLIDRLWSDRSVQAVFVNGPEAVYVERNGVVEPAAERFRDRAHLDELLGRLVHGPTQGIVAVRLRDGGAGTVVFPPAAPTGPVLAIRRGDPGEATFERLIASELIDSRTADLLRIAARARLNILVAGPVGSGKTAVLAAIARDVGAMRVVTVAPHRAFRWPSPTKIELVAEASGLGLLIDAALRLQPDILVLDAVASRDLPVDRKGVVAAMADGAEGAADVVVKLGRAPDGLFRVLALSDATGAEIFPAPDAPSAFAEALRQAGYGDVLARLLG